MGSGITKEKGFTMLNGTKSIGVVMLKTIFTGEEQFETPVE